MEHHDVAVLGLGVNGAATVHELARRGVDVVGIDMTAPPNSLGSSNGRTRIIREAYFEHPVYVPLVQRAYELWSELEELTGTVLYRRTGGVSAGPPDGVLVRGALASAREHALEHEVLDADELRRRFPALLPDANHIGIVEPRAGVLLVEPCIRTLLTLAVGYGATLHTDRKVTAWRVDGGDVAISTSGGTLRARHLVIAAGAWLNPVLAMDASDDARAPLQLPVTVERQAPHLFTPAAGTGAKFSAAACPVTLLEYAAGRWLYTLPDVGHGIKAGIHHEGTITTADTVDREVTTHDERLIRRALDHWMPGAADRIADAEVCLYTNTPDGHFLIDHHPTHDNVLLLSACSGHGFKFGPAVGELAADLVMDGETWTGTDVFELRDRFS